MLGKETILETLPRQHLGGWHEGGVGTGRQTGFVYKSSSLGKKHQNHN